MSRFAGACLAARPRCREGPPRGFEPLQSRVRSPVLSSAELRRRDVTIGGEKLGVPELGRPENGTRRSPRRGARTGTRARRIALPVCRSPREANRSTTCAESPLSTSTTAPAHRLDDFGGAPSDPARGRDGKVRMEGVEPPRPKGRRFLRPVRLPGFATSACGSTSRRHGSGVRLVGLTRHPAGAAARVVPPRGEPCGARRGRSPSPAGPRAPGAAARAGRGAGADACASRSPFVCDAEAVAAPKATPSGICRAAGADPSRGNPLGGFPLANSSEGAAGEVRDQLRRRGVEAHDVEHSRIGRVCDREVVRDHADHDRPGVDARRAAATERERAPGVTRTRRPPGSAGRSTENRLASGPQAVVLESPRSRAVMTGSVWVR